MLNLLKISLFIFCFLKVVYSNAGQFIPSRDNQMLSSIYSEFNNDFIAWDELPKYEEFSDPSQFFLNSIISGNADFDDITNNFNNFSVELIKALKNLNRNYCSKLSFDNPKYIFEEVMFNSYNFWMSYCNQENFTNNSLDQKLNLIDSRFQNIQFINRLYFYYLENESAGILNLYKELDSSDLIYSLNSKEINLTKNIFNKQKINFDDSRIFQKSNSFSGLTLELDESYQINDFRDLIYAQVFQTGIYYFYAQQYSDAIGLLSYLELIDEKNKDFYIFKKLSLFSELLNDEKLINRLEKQQFSNVKFDFFKQHLLISLMNENDLSFDELTSFNKGFDGLTEWQKLELNLEIAIEMHSRNENLIALKFIEDCCLDLIDISQDPIHLFKYGILLERNEKTKKAEQIIKRSIDLSNNKYPYILNYLAYLWVENNKNLDEAEQMLLQAVEDSNYEDGAILDSLGWLYFKKNNIELAEKWVHQAYLMEPAEPEIIDHLSQIYKKLGRDKESIFLDNKIILFHIDYYKYQEIINRYEG